MKKRLFVIIVSFVILFSIVTFLITKYGDGVSKSDKPVLYTTIFPEYDFAKHIVGDKMEVLRLIEPGVEIHTYEPSAKDMIRIAKSKLFIYTGKDMEPWASDIIEAIKDYDVKIVDVSQNVDMIETSEFMSEYSLLDYEEENHNHDEKDGHIWMNPQNACIMIDTILENVIEIDPENKEFYEENSRKYKNEILSLDKEIEESLRENNINVLVFGGEFGYSYFCRRYNLKVVSCYTACGEGQEPSIARIRKVIDYIKENQISKIYYEELSEGQISQMISEETSSEPQVFNTVHNVLSDSGKTYVDIMRENLNKIIN